MEKDEVLGRVVLSTAGRDEGKYYIVIDMISDNYVLLVDGRLRTENKPKKKKLRHLRFTDIIAEDIKRDILSGNELSNSTIRRYLQLNDINKEV
ncbi:KOW domain-containing RNA-binding protein [Clostridium thermarum]|uniref:KOW domain-containing RNA-binding protein n=1 Tax=Clostridium thermarum TaxID=1716543 RepID=UPI0011221670|nr:KOW domain-containing RNA-binding protein [Clostridium thermarum]